MSQHLCRNVPMASRQKKVTRGKGPNMKEMTCELSYPPVGGASGKDLCRSWIYMDVSCLAHGLSAGVTQANMIHYCSHPASVHRES